MRRIDMARHILTKSKNTLLYHLLANFRPHTFFVYVSRLYTVVLLLGKSSWGLMYEVASKNGGQLLCSIEVIISTLATRENCQNSVICQILRWILGFLSFEWLQSARGKRAAFLRQLWILTFRHSLGNAFEGQNRTQWRSRTGWRFKYWSK